MGWGICIFALVSMAVAAPRQLQDRQVDESSSSLSTTATSNQESIAQSTRVFTATATQSKAWTATATAVRGIATLKTATVIHTEIATGTGIATATGTSGSGETLLPIVFPDPPIVVEGSSEALSLCPETMTSSIEPNSTVTSGNPTSTVEGQTTATKTCETSSEREQRLDQAALDDAQSKAKPDAEAAASKDAEEQAKKKAEDAATKKAEEAAEKMVEDLVAAAPVINGNKHDSKEHTSDGRATNYMNDFCNGPFKNGGVDAKRNDMFVKYGEKWVGGDNSNNQDMFVKAWWHAQIGLTVEDCINYNKELLDKTKYEGLVKQEGWDDWTGGTYDRYGFYVEWKMET